VRLEGRARMKTCSVYVPGYMKRYCGVVVVFDRALTPAWTVVKDEGLREGELSTVMALEGGDVRGMALFVKGLSVCGKENTADIKSGRRRKYIVWMMSCSGRVLWEELVKLYSLTKRNVGLCKSFLDVGSNIIWLLKH